jgi:PQQ-dependent dehydrogenase (methanol/ethanol family)
VVVKSLRLFAVLLVGGVALAAVVGASAEKKAIAPIPAFSAAQLSAMPTKDWAAPHGDYFNQQYSALTQINKGNVARLKIAWHTHAAIPSAKKQSYKGLSAEGQPVVYNGTMYIPDAKGNIYALDAQTGERLWYYKPKWPKGFVASFPNNRGVAIGDGKVYMGQNDGSMVGLDAATGRVAWRTKIGSFKLGYFYTSAPTYVNGTVISGTSGGDWGADVKVNAFDAKTGKIRWTFHVIPQGNQLGANTWPAHRAWVGGGAIWATPVVDAKLGLVYVGVGNPIPYNGNVRGSGQELFTESVLALHLKTGKYAWHYQTTHHDIWDYDTAANPLVAFDMKIKGKMRHVIVSANKTGWVYMLDRRTGKPILGINEKKVPQEASQHTWPTQPIPVGEPFAAQCPDKQERAAWMKAKTPDGSQWKFGCIYTPYNESGYTVFGPSALGGTDWPASSFSPRTGYLYVCAKDTFTGWKALPEATAGKLKPLGNFFQVEGLFPIPGTPGNKGVGKVVAMNMRSNTRSWTVTWGAGDICYSGITTTRGGLLFVGRSQGYVEAYDDLTGKRLWRSPKLLAGANAPVSTYMLNGKQYVVIYAGGNSIGGSFGHVKPRYGSEVYAFALPSK